MRSTEVPTITKKPLELELKVNPIPESNVFFNHTNTKNFTSLENTKMIHLIGICGNFLITVFKEEESAEHTKSCFMLAVFENKKPQATFTHRYPENVMVHELQSMSVFEKEGGKEELQLLLVVEEVDKRKVALQYMIKETLRFKSFVNSNLDYSSRSSPMLKLSGTTDRCCHFLFQLDYLQLIYFRVPREGHTRWYTNEAIRGYCSINNLKAIEQSPTSKIIDFAFSSNQPDSLQRGLCRTACLMRDSQSASLLIFDCRQDDDGKVKHDLQAAVKLPVEGGSICSSMAKPTGEQATAILTVKAGRLAIASVAGMKATVIKTDIEVPGKGDFMVGEGHLVWQGQAQASKAVHVNYVWLRTINKVVRVTLSNDGTCVVEHLAVEKIKEHWVSQLRTKTITTFAAIPKSETTEACTSELLIGLGDLNLLSLLVKLEFKQLKFPWGSY